MASFDNRKNHNNEPLNVIAFGKSSATHNCTFQGSAKTLSLFKTVRQVGNMGCSLERSAAEAVIETQPALPEEVMGFIQELTEPLPTEPLPCAAALESAATTKEGGTRGCIIQ